MSMTFLEYSAAMIGCFAAMAESEREQLHAWETEHLDGSGLYGTSDWPGWEKYIGKYSSPPREARCTAGYVYLVRASTGHYKIGSSRSVEQRFRHLQCGNPQPLTLAHKFYSLTAERDEFELHRRFAGQRVMNEWFQLSATDVASIAARFGRRDV